MKHLPVAFLAGLVLAAGPVLAQRKPAPKAKAKTVVSARSAAVLRGKSVYVQNCLSCHQADGLGVESMNPPLAKTSYVLGDKPRLVGVLLHGLRGVDIDGERYNSVMPAQESLTDQQIADVLTYVRVSFGNKASAVTTAEVQAVRAGGKQ